MVFVLWVLCFATTARATIYAVKKIVDDGSQNTLSWAIGQANLTPGNTVVFEAIPDNSTLTFNPGINLPIIRQNMIIDGSGVSGLTLDGANTNYLFFIYPGNVQISSIILTRAVSQGGAGGSGGGFANGGAGVVD